MVRREHTLQITSPISRFIDHDDKVSEVKLGDAYALTSRAWLARFKVPYSQCGCHQGDLSAIDEGLSSIIPHKLKFWNKGESKTDQRRRAIEKVIAEMEVGERDASHPSVHNLVVVSHEPVVVNMGADVCRSRLLLHNDRGPNV